MFWKNGKHNQICLEKGLSRGVQFYLCSFWLYDLWCGIIAFQKSLGVKNKRVAVFLRRQKSA